MLFLTRFGGGGGHLKVIIDFLKTCYQLNGTHNSKILPIIIILFTLLFKCYYKTFLLHVNIKNINMNIGIEILVVT
jgi:hypothetical protein